MSDIPGYTEAVQAAAKTCYEVTVADLGLPEDEAFDTWEQLDPAYRDPWLTDARRYLAAAVPHIERAIRDKIADEIERSPWDYKPGSGGLTWRDGMDCAARVARGGEATE